MTTPLRFHPDARADLLDQIQYYETIIPELGARFLRAVEATVERIARNPLAGAEAPRGTHRRIVAGFPFSVLYRVEPAGVQIIAIQHHRQSPGRWMRRLQ